MALFPGLPIEVITEIFSYLLPEDLLRVALVCRLFNRISTPLIYRCVSYIPLGMIEQDAFQEEGCVPKTRILDLESFYRTITKSEALRPLVYFAYLTWRRRIFHYPGLSYMNNTMFNMLESSLIEKIHEEFCSGHKIPRQINLSPGFCTTEIFNRNLPITTLDLDMKSLSDEYLVQDTGNHGENRLRINIEKVSEILDLPTLRKFMLRGVNTWSQWKIESEGWEKKLCTSNALSKPTSPVEHLVFRQSSRPGSELEILLSRIKKLVSFKMSMLRCHSTGRRFRQLLYPHKDTLEEIVLVAGQHRCRGHPRVFGRYLRQFKSLKHLAVPYDFIIFPKQYFLYYPDSFKRYFRIQETLPESIETLSIMLRDFGIAHTKNWQLDMRPREMFELGTKWSIEEADAGMDFDIARWLYDITMYRDEKFPRLRLIEFLRYERIHCEILIQDIINGKWWAQTVKEFAAMQIVLRFGRQNGFEIP